MELFFYHLAILPYYYTGFSPSISVIIGLLFCGAMGILTLFAISFYLVNRKSVYLCYGLFLLLSLVGGIINMNYDFQLLDKEQRMGYQASLWLEVSTLSAFVAYSWFIIHLFDLKKEVRKLYYWIKAMANSTFLYLILYTIFFSQIAPYEGLFFLISRFGIIGMSITAIIWLMVKVHSPVKTLFVIGSMWYFIGAFVSTLVQLYPNLPVPFIYGIRTTIYFEGGLLLETFCFGLALSYKVLLSYQTRQKEEEHLRIQAEYEKNLIQAEMLATRSQLNPHFLFNSLNAIHLLIQKRESTKAGQYLIILSRFFRMVLELPKSKSISLSEEIKLLKYYIRLEERRFQDDFHFNIKTIEEEELSRIKIPPLILQPFVENAIWHGLLPSEKQEKSLQITVDKTEEKVYIFIEDNGIGRGHRHLSSDCDKVKGKKSMGMKITKKRIENYNKSYDYQIALNIIDKKSKSGNRMGTKVVLTIDNCKE